MEIIRDPRTGHYPTVIIHDVKEILIAIYDRGPLPDYDNSVNSVEPLWQYHYEVTLPPGYAYCDIKFYIEGTAVFESVTYWNVLSGSDGTPRIGVGLWNWDDPLIRYAYHLYSETPAWDTSYTWSYPARYSHSVWNPTANYEIHYNVYYEWYYE
ncbi:MAG: hypothetical protein NDF54_04565 [archaeon GB-1867-035]|nr:hypothetical protein [Candidatus Culexmicrobium profundum]